MTDHKFTDEEIIKALECCCSTSVVNCEKCVYAKPSIDDYCANILMRDALDLINRQKAEIERLQKAGEEAVSCFHRMESLYNIKCMELKVAKAEAIKEFAERLKEKAYIPKPYGAAKVVDEYVIDNLVKEMTEGK